MSLSAGKVSLAVLNKAGKVLQEECNKHAPLLDGDIVATDGFGLPCDKVFHICCPVWKGSDTEKVFKLAILFKV